jgi:hypothetical protein
VARDYYESSSDDYEFPPLSKLLSKQRGVSAAAKLNLGSMTENAVNHTLDGNPTNLSESRAGGGQG